MGVGDLTSRQFSDVLDRVIELEEQMEESGVSMDGFELADPPLSYAMIAAPRSAILKMSHVKMLERGEVPHIYVLEPKAYDRVRRLDLSSALISSALIHRSWCS